MHLGAFLLLRISPILELSIWLSGTVVVLGLLTAIYATLAGRVQSDIKTALAFASLTQVGIIVVEIGLGLRYIALIHILGHAALRTLQLLRAPTLLHDYHVLENALDGHLPQNRGWLSRRMPDRDGAVVLSVRTGAWVSGRNAQPVFRSALCGMFSAVRFIGTKLDQSACRGRPSRFGQRSDPQRIYRRAQVLIMIELHLPWLELAVLTPLIGALVACFVKNPEKTRVVAIAFSGIALALAFSAWEDFNFLKVFEAHDRWDVVSPILGPDAMVVDELNAPLLTLTALMFFLTPLATLRTKLKRFPFRMNLVSEFLMLATLACRSPWGIIVLMALQTLPLIWEIRSRGKSARGFVIHMALFVGLFVAGWAMISQEDANHEHSIVAISLLTVAVLIRSGCAPLHCWMTDLFEKATLGSSLLFVSPMIGAYAAVRLILPIAPDWALRVIALASLFTAVYSAGMALVQTETRRFFCYLLLSNASLVLVGLEVVTPIGLTGALCTWMAVAMSFVGFGLTLRAIESRVGRLSLRDFHGLYSQMPTLATFFLLTGLAIVGFPGTVGFAGIELIVEGSLEVFPYVGATVVIAAALNGIAILRVYFRLFTGTEYQTTFSMEARWPEKVTVLILSFLIIAGGIYPQPGVQSRYHAAKEIMAHRDASLESSSPVSGLSRLFSDSADNPPSNH